MMNKAALAVMGLGVVGLGLALAPKKAGAAQADRPAPKPGDYPPSDVIARIQASIQRGPAAMREEAIRLRAEGWTLQADALEQAAAQLEAMASRPQPQQSAGVGKPPVSGPPPTPPGPIPASIPVPVPTTFPPAGSVSPGIAQIPTPKPVIVPTNMPLASRVALMLESSAPSGPVKDVPLLATWKQSVGLKDSAKYYGPGTAKSLALRGIVPPTPWDWGKNPAKAKKDLRDNYLYLARKDSARREEWQRAAEAIGV